MQAPPATASATRQQQRIDDVCAAALRALCDDAQLHFRGQRLYRGAQRLSAFAPHVNAQVGVDDFASFRGATDAMALRLTRNDPAVHLRFRPSEPLPRMVFEMLAQFRVEALAPEDKPGMAHNLRQRFEAWSLAFYNSGLLETSKGILLYTVAQITRSRVTAQPVVEATEDAIEATRMAIVPRLGHHLAGLRRQRHDQSRYAEHALWMAHWVSTELSAYDSDESANDEDNADANPNPLSFNLWMDFDGDDAPDGFASASQGTSSTWDEAQMGYRIFTQDFDSVVEVATLVRPALLKDLRDTLDQRIAQQGLSVAQVARALQAALATPVRDGWLSEQEEGYIDGRQLSQLITSPTERRLFRVEQHTPQASSAVSFLIDCSGSMRQHIEAVAVMVDVMARALEQIGVLTEVLGFSTHAWQGGRAQRAWQRAGRPARPGRLNEVAHLVFKDRDTRWQRARPAMGALLKSDLFREGVDGEAVAWAAQRLLTHTEGRRLLLVVSDGSPTDGATALANDAHYLDQHLSHVVSGLEAKGEVEVYGIGVGLDLSPYYRNNRAFDLSASVNQAMLRELVAMIHAGPRRRVSCR